MIDALWMLDKKLFFWINGFAGGPLDYLFGWTTFLITPIIFIFVLVFIFIWDPDKALKKFSLVLVMSLVGGIILPSILKHFINRPRPLSAFYDDIGHGRVVVNSILQLFLSNSFPSGHSALVFAVATALNLLYKNKLLFLYPLAACLAITRVYIGAHFPSDVVAGAIVGTLGAAAAHPLAKRMTRLN